MSPRLDSDLREGALRYQRKESSRVRDIGDIPPIRFPERRRRAEASFEAFCIEYQPGIFTRKFAPVHLEVIKRLEEAICVGGMFAYAMPRGCGKTSLAEAACLWALLTGKRKYVVLISATEKHAQQSLGNIKKEFSSNDFIYQDWPEIVYPVWSLENIPHRASGQLLYGESTYLIWRGEQLVLPTTPDNPASGSVIETRGLTGAIRGMKCNLPGGMGSIRPDQVILDDPQTDESARSNGQCENREQIILGTVLGLAGHEHAISVAMPCTVIKKGDLAEKFLDRDSKPEWHGTRRRLLEKMPANVKLWDEYCDLRREGDDVARQFYIDNREDMDAGAVPLWEECFTNKQVSAIQYAMDLKAIVGDQAFWAEYQNEPMDDLTDGEMMTVEDICNKTTGFKQGQVPENCQYLTGHIDVHKNVLYWMICGWRQDFTGWVIDYGVFPPSGRKFFMMRELRDSLQARYGGMGVEGAIYAGLKELSGKLITKTWGLSGLRLGKVIIDANWKTSLVKTFCRESDYGAIIVPGHGRYIGADRKPLNEYKKHPGDRSGVNWRIPAPLDHRSVRHVVYDINFWKSHVNAAVLSPPGEKGCLQLYKGDHSLLATHWTAEYFVETSARGRTIRQWQPFPHADDNHWWDCIVGCAVGASIQGCSTVEETAKHGRIRIRYLD